MKKECKKCHKTFLIEEEDTRFYERVGVPAPNYCPRCRQQNRMAFRNEVKLYKRKCDYSGNLIISMYSEDKPFKVYDSSIWWSDKWDPMEYGRDFDFTRPFFEQFGELQKEVPRMALVHVNNENCDFTSYTLGNKNGYMLFTADYNENCLYGRFADKNYRSCDIAYTWESTDCYETVDTHSCNNVNFSQKCYNCSDLYFCYNLRGCHNCIFCANLVNKNYYIFNKSVSQDEFENFKQQLKLGSYKALQEAWVKFRDFIKDKPRKALEVVNCENALGDYLTNSKNAKFCFDSNNLEDCKYVTHNVNTKDSYDWDFVGEKCELCYNMVSSSSGLFNCKFCMNCWVNNSNLIYCDLCISSQDLFGCIGLKKKQYCILNKQYSEAEYKNLVQKIIEHMQRTGEWGEFFPVELSPYAYNETVAQEHYPLSKEDAVNIGYKWMDKDDREYLPQKYEIPDDIADVPETIVNEVLACIQCGKNFKITKQELEIYKRKGFPIPRKCFYCRHIDRQNLRNKRILYNSSCSKCGKEIVTTYSPEEGCIVYCQKCYLDEIG